MLHFWFEHLLEFTEYIYGDLISHNALMADPVNVYYTHPVSSATQQRLAALFAAADVSGGPFRHITYNPAHNSLSPIQLLQGLHYDFGRYSYAIIVDQRTEEEIYSAHPTVTVTTAWEITPAYEWEIYDGDINLDELPEIERLTLLHGLAEARAVQDGDPWVWESNSEQRELHASLWQVKSVRADVEGAEYICGVYSVKDRNDMHRLVGLHASCVIRVTDYKVCSSNRLLIVTVDFSTGLLLKHIRQAHVIV